MATIDLRSSDLAVVLDAARAQGPARPDAETVLRALSGLVACDDLFWQHLRLRPDVYTYSLELPDPSRRPTDCIPYPSRPWCEHLHEHPVMSGRNGVLASMEDVLSPTELRRLWVWNTYMVPGGVRHEIGLHLPHGPDAVNVLVLQRSGAHDFDDDDRMVLRLLRPHLAAAFAAAAPGASLTARQVQVLRLVKEGLPDKTIARQLGCAEATVGKHLEHAFQRLGAHSRIHALQLAGPILDDAPGW